MRNKAMIEVFSEEELELLDKLHVVLSSHDASKEFLSDVQMQLRLICKTYRSKIIIPIRSVERGFDLQIKRRVLTKIRGTEMMVGPLLSEEAKGATLVPLCNLHLQTEYLHLNTL